MNNSSIYQSQLDETRAEGGEAELQAFLTNQRSEALASYPPGKEIKFCRICHEPMKYKSLAYHEGFHFDSCL